MEELIGGLSGWIWVAYISLAIWIVCRIGFKDTKKFISKLSIIIFVGVLLLLGMNEMMTVVFAIVVIFALFYFIGGFFG